MIDLKNICREVEKIILAKNHRPLNANILSHKKFLKNQIKEIKEIELKYPFIKFDSEKLCFESQI